ncbi:hypothetical protein [Microbacterium sp. EST19A]|uniref:hypothetical protein n=1 Tax=Microbacterium sp. EST19A TaxID=2862681 RepID=UPI001CC13EEF|nr:hypothetical protein [Microbacterium sp. EST19A]
MASPINPYLLSLSRYRVKGAVVVARLHGGAEKYIYRNGLLPETTLPSQVEHLEALGLIEKVEAA